MLKIGHLTVQQWVPEFSSVSLKLYAATAGKNPFCAHINKMFNLLLFYLCVLNIELIAYLDQ